MMLKFFLIIDIIKMNFYCGNINFRNSIFNGYIGMGICISINNYVLVLFII